MIRGRQTILHRVLGALFAVMAIFQLADLPGFVGVLETFQLGDAAWTLAVALLAGELASGGWLLVAPGRRPLVPALVFAATSAMWSALAAQAFARGLVLDNCGCFGVYLAQPLRWWVLVQDAALLGYSALLLRARRPSTAGYLSRRPRGAPPRLLSRAEARPRPPRTRSVAAWLPALRDVEVVERRWTITQLGHSGGKLAGLWPVGVLHRRFV